MLESRQLTYKEVADETNTSPQLVEYVVMDAYDKFRKAFVSNNSLEITGFGTYHVSLNKLNKKILKVEEMLKKDLTDEVRSIYIKDLNILYGKRDAHNRGLEKSSSSSKRNETSN